MRRNISTVLCTAYGAKYNSTLSLVVRYVKTHNAIWVQYSLYIAILAATVPVVDGTGEAARRTRTRVGTQSAMLRNPTVPRQLFISVWNIQRNISSVRYLKCLWLAVCVKYSVILLEVAKLPNGRTVNSGTSSKIVLYFVHTANNVPYT